MMARRKGLESLIPLLAESHSSDYYRIRRSLRTLSDDERRVLDHKMDDVLRTFKKALMK